MTEAVQRQIFEEWMDQYKNLIFKIVRAYSVSSMDRDDLFQEISIQVWNSIPVFRNESAVTTWLYRISLNTAIKWTKKEGRRKEEHEPLRSVHYVLEDNTTAVDERLSWLYNEISKLDEVDRSIALLLMEGFSYREMSEILGITESNVGVKINRIKKHLINKSKYYENNGI
ncbi:MAG: RNA polymerase sigma factor [Cyclobacteriaceae bacterium]|nr:RNA polymerase sigma factor [Cyclobacteriaceae bacterium]